MMKKLIIITAALAWIAMVQAPTKLVVKGSDTVLPLSQKEAESFMKSNKGAAITVVGGGSGVGISALLDGTTDIAMSSRKLKLDEKMKLQESGKSVKEVIVAYDALAVIVNPGNKVTQLTREQVEGIFIGRITNWKQVGGDDLQIIAYSRETSSGTYEFFKEHVMKKKNYSPKVLNMPATGAIIQSVSQTKGAIGYVGLAYLEKDVRALRISYDGKTFVEPTMTNAKSKSYPVVRPLYYYYSVKSESKVKSFVDFILSGTGQSLVEQVGYVPVK